MNTAKCKTRAPRAAAQILDGDHQQAVIEVITENAGSATLIMIEAKLLEKHLALPQDLESSLRFSGFLVNAGVVK